MNFRILTVVFAAYLAIHVPAQSRVSDANWAKQAVVQYKLLGIDPMSGATSKRRTAMFAFLVCQKIVEQANLLGKKIEALEKLVNESSNRDEWTDEEVKVLRKKVSELGEELQVAKSWNDDCDHLRDVLKSHKAQFRELGIDTAWMSVNIRDLRSRLVILANKRQNFSGCFSLNLGSNPRTFTDLAKIRGLFTQKGSILLAGYV